MSSETINRGEIYFVALDPVFGREIGGFKTRPVVVLSINDLNRKPLTVTVVPGTTAKGNRSFNNAVKVLPSKVNGLKNETVFQCHQLRAIDKGRFIGQRIGSLIPADLTAIERATRYSLGLVD